jgi:S-DNA-T family DNA segregation ATPase FtsK/SpoIIIE
MVGNIGRVFGEANLNIFGYLAYIDLIILLYPLYRLYYNKRLLTKMEFFVGWMLFFISLIILQSLLLEFSQSGTVGTTLKLFLLPYIGKAGIWLLWLLALMVSFVLLYDEIPELRLAYTKVKELKEFIVTTAKDMLSKIDNPFFDKQSTEVMTTIISSQGRGQKEQLKPIIKPKRPKKIIHKKKKTKKVSNKERSLLENVAIEEEKVDIDNEIITEPISKVNIVEELEENRELLNQIEQGKIDKPKNFILPKLDFLHKPPKKSKKINEAEIDRKIGELLDKLGQFKIEGDVYRTYSGPLVTTFEFKPAPNVKVSKIMSLQDDLAMALSAETIRIQAPIPGRDVVGIEIPNDSFDTIYLRDILENKIFTNSKSPLTMAMGKDIVGNPFVTDLKRLPHLLIAGTTGSGKSVGINAMILSLLYRNDPDNLKLMLIDPKMLELSIYNDIPHLLTPVITDAQKAIAALANMVAEMERRYTLMAESRTKNIENYNEKIAKKKSVERLPYIVVVIDELADLMMNGGKDVEYSIARLAQMARASGIHLIVATQRPSVDVVTGIIKANLPSRLSYRVGQRIDSKVILDALGADSLLGRGDALFTPPGANGLVRLHAPWNSEEEIEEIVEFLKEQRPPDYDEKYLISEENSIGAGKGITGELDELYEQAKEVILMDQKTSISYLQRKLQIGYNRSANIIEQLQEMGVLSPPNNKGQRDILL